MAEFKIAAVVTIYRPWSHADVIVSRWLEPRAEDEVWGWGHPRTRIVSLYIDQVESDDTGRALAARNGIPVVGSVSDALTLGAGGLAVDAVLLIGEHGGYPYNEIGQKMYPRKQLFDQVVQVMQASGRFVPVYCDKHLSWNFAWAKEMVATARELGIPLMAGSSLPYSPLQPPPAMTDDTLVEEVLAVAYDVPEAYGYHSIESSLALLERRSGGERGVTSVRALRGSSVWEAMERGTWSRELFDAAIFVSRRPRIPPDGWGTGSAEPEPIAFSLTHADGFTSTHLILEGYVSDFSIAMKLRGDPRPHASCVMLGGPEDFFGHFAKLDSVIEDFFLSGRPAVPIERTLLATGAIAACMKALTQPGARFPTPELEIPYRGLCR
ncbi:MAG: hypothetical protein ACREQM_07905 [Candidatus Dormibacteraceae bacterium]